MPVVPGSLDTLLSLLAPAFTAPTFQTFRALVVGFPGRIGEGQNRWKYSSNCSSSMG